MPTSWSGTKIHGELPWKVLQKPYKVAINQGEGGGGGGGDVKGEVRPPCKVKEDLHSCEVLSVLANRTTGTGLTGNKDIHVARHALLEG